MWRGSIYLGDGVLAYDGAIGPTARHAHHAIQIAICLNGDGDGDLSIDDRRDRAFLIPADTPHAITAPCPRALLVFVDPETDAGVALGGRRASELHVEAPLDLRKAVDVLLGPVPSRPTRHAAVEEALRTLPGLVADGEIRAGELARRVGLSESRLLHVFREATGIALRPYVRWLRLKLVARAVRGGANLTEAAHAAGFSDSSHLSNVFHEMFGLAPSEIVRGADWVE